MNQEPLARLKEGYSRWLQTLGFAPSSVKSLPQYIEELLEHLTIQGVTEATNITETEIDSFFLQWKGRKNKTRGGGLSASHINKGSVALNNFIKFLNSTGKSRLSLKVGRETVPDKLPTVLSLEEVEQMYQSTYHNNRRVHAEAYGQRDRAMLAVYYSCGLRRSEGSALQVTDVDLEKKLLHVRKGKGSKSRLVPIPERGLQDLATYLQEGRDWFLCQRQKKEAPKSSHVFINHRGNPMRDFTARLQQLKEDTDLEKEVSLHTLRHSVATHLLQGGMKIDQIRRFLGHTSLESTQLYTHIVDGDL